MVVLSSRDLVGDGADDSEGRELQKPTWIDGMQTSDWEVLFDGEWNQPSALQAV